MYIRRRPITFGFIFQERPVQVRVEIYHQSVISSGGGSIEDPGETSQMIRVGNEIVPVKRLRWSFMLLVCFQVHYYEDGNVQLVSHKEVEESIVVNVSRHKHHFSCMVNACF